MVVGAEASNWQAALPPVLLGIVVPGAHDRLFDANEAAQVDQRRRHNDFSRARVDCGRQCRQLLRAIPDAENLVNMWGYVWNTAAISAADSRGSTMVAPAAAPGGRYLQIAEDGLGMVMKGIATLATVSAIFRVESV